MQPETYTLMHRMFCVASSKNELEIMLRRFQGVIDATKDSAEREDIFDNAWATSCVAGLYARLHEPYLAEQTYVEAIRKFHKNEMALNAATICVALANLYEELGNLGAAEFMLEQNIKHLIKRWGAGSRHVMAAEEELKHFQLTGQIIEASKHHWCKACEIDDYGVGFDFEDTDRAER